MPLAQGCRLNKYEIVALIGEGGMGEVYRAVDTQLRRHVALKVLPVEIATESDRVDRFRTEARAIAALNNPHIVTIYSIEECGGIHFLTMELVEGQTLTSVVDDGVSAERFMAIAVPLAEAVAAAHAAGITHRDLKPQNVMFGRDGRLKVLDFGVARVSAAAQPLSDRSTTLRTQEGTVVGTVPYMSPEQLRGAAVDARSDIFSLGVMLYEIGAGRRPFVGDSSIAVTAAILRDAPPPLAALAPWMPAAVRDVVERCLEKDPAARFADGSALHRALLDIHRQRQPVSHAEPAPRDHRANGAPFVGRDTEYGRLDTCVSRAVRGNGTLVLIGGEPGVGKTRLAEELLADARDRGLLVVTGRCYEAGTIPFSPIVELFEQILREVPAAAVRGALGPDAPDLATLVPHIRHVWDDIPEPGPLEPAQQRRVLFNAVLEFFRRISIDRPVVMLLDDLHWADEATLGVLQHIAPQLSRLRLVTVATYRDAEVVAGTAFEKAMAVLVRHEPGVLRVPLRSLTQTAVAELLRALAGSEPPTAVVNAIFQQTEGNPFFVGEVFKHLSEEGRLFDSAGAWQLDVATAADEVPETVRLVIGRRLQRLHEATRAVLTTAAVIGRQFELRLIESLCRLDDEAFLDAIEEAETARLIAPERSGRQTRYAFTHELIRSTLLSGVSLLRRQRLHGSIAQAMQAGHPSSSGGSVAAIAHHLYEAGPAADEAEAIRFLVLAGDQAVETGAVESGLSHYQRALSLLADDGADMRATLLWKCGLAYRSLGQLRLAIESWEAALAIRATGGDHDAVVMLCVELAHSYVWSAQPALGTAVARRGLAIVGAEASASRCRLLGSLAWSLSMAGDFEAADPIMRDALAMADTLGDAQRGELLLLGSWHYYLCMRRREQRDACRQASELLRAAGDSGKLAEALANLEASCIQTGRPRDVERTERETAALADRLGRYDVKVFHLYAAAQRSWMLDGDLGRFDAGIEAAAAVAGAWGWLAEATQAQALLWRGDLDAATARARMSFSHEPQASTLRGGGWAMVFLCDCTAGRRDEALALLGECGDALPRRGRFNSIGSWTALFKVVEGLALVGALDRAAALYPVVVEALATESVVTFDASHLLDTIAGIAAAAGGQWDAAAKHYETAIELADRMPFAVAQADARYWYARLLLERGTADGPGRARPLVDAALTQYRRIGMPWHVARADALLPQP